MPPARCPHTPPHDTMSLNWPNRESRQSRHLRERRPLHNRHTRTTPVATPQPSPHKAVAQRPVVVATRPKSNQIANPTPKLPPRPQRQTIARFALPRFRKREKTLNYPPKLNIQTRPPAPPCHPGFPLPETFAQPSFPHPSDSQPREGNQANKQPPFCPPHQLQKSTKKHNIQLKIDGQLKRPAAPVTAWGEHHSIERRSHGARD